MHNFFSIILKRLMSKHLAYNNLQEENMTEADDEAAAADDETPAAGKAILVQRDGDGFVEPNSRNSKPFPNMLEAYAESVTHMTNLLQDYHGIFANIICLYMFDLQDVNYVITLRVGGWHGTPVIILGFNIPVKYSFWKLRFLPVM